MSYLFKTLFLSLSLGGTAAGGSYGIGYLINGKGGGKSRTLVRRSAENRGTDSHSSPSEKGESGPQTTRNDNHEASSRASSVSTGTEDSGATNSGTHSAQTQSNLGGGNNLRSEESISTSISLNREKQVDAELIYNQYFSGDGECYQLTFKNGNKENKKVSSSSCKDLKSIFWNTKDNQNPVFWLRTTQNKIQEILKEYQSLFGEENIEKLISGNNQNFKNRSLKCEKEIQSDQDVVVSCHGIVGSNNLDGGDDDEDEED
ncbi:hypothetical protein [Mycoplasma suis]|uniref:Uncharacterized protein n=2 Tax=Mycoplasma suis TaxID=57372 RepID=F0QQB5_MYCSL|nr:hypothetical protein [Mycoplasma suis]ADX97685.1 hypothetical protein MSU_0141 [Mycoplasma suis str. Illinois]CBZ40224.1 hypothetical protein MSUIS_01310 [Mycoplasma suis KI3806]